MLNINFSQFENLQEAMKAYEGNTENIINEVLHGEASELIQDEIKRLMPVSGRKWKGKAPAAKNAKSLTAVTANLSVTVKTTKKYHYLYFPDDGSNTRHHAGNQQFFHRAGEAKTAEIVDRCINRLVNSI
jgi:hypothetical protein